MLKNVCIYKKIKAVKKKISYIFQVISEQASTTRVDMCIILHYNMYYFHLTLQEPC